MTSRYPMLMCVLAALLVGGCGGADTPKGGADPTTPGVTVRGDETQIDGKDSTYQSGTTLPDGWPSEVVLPSAAVITTSSRSARSGRCDLAVTSTIAGDHVTDAERHFASVLGDWKRTASSDAGASGARVVNRTYERADDQLQLTISVQTGRTVVVALVMQPC